MSGYGYRKRLAVLLLTGICAIVLACATPGPVEYPAVRIEGAHHSGSIKVAFSPANTYLASSGYFGEVKIWSLPDLKPALSFSKHRDTPYGLLWRDDQTLISGDNDGWIYSWRITDGEVLQSVITLSGISALAMAADNNRVISGHHNGMLRVFGADSLKQIAEYDAGSRILAMAADRTRNRLAVACRNGTVFVLDLDRNELKAVASPPGKVFEIAFSPDGGKLAGGGWFRLYFWDISKNTVDVIESDHWGAVYSIDYTPDGKHLASIGRHTDSQIFLIDLTSGGRQRRLLRHELCGSVVRISPDGRYLASGSDDASIRLYDLAAPKQNGVPLRLKRTVRQ